MSSRISLWTGLIGVGATIALVQPNIAAAKSSVEIADTAKAITVLITEPNSVGSGVILQRQGDTYTVLTAAHVVKNAASYKIATSDDRSYQVIPNSIRRAPGNIDLAVVKFKSTAKYPTAKLGNCNVLKSGMDLYVGGFPGASGTITEPVFVFREGKVSANSTKTFEKGYSLVYSNDTLKGMSGGAVLNRNGELVAIHGRGDRERLNDGQYGEKTGFNLGIPINRCASVASNMGVDLGGKIAPIPKNVRMQADDYVVSAIQNFDKGNYQVSLADFNTAIQLNANSAPAYYYRGVIKAFTLADTKGGLTDIDRAIQLDQKFADAYAVRGLVKGFKLQDSKGGLVDLDRAIQLEPNNTQAYGLRGLLKAIKLKDTPGGLADGNRTVQLEPNNAQYYGFLGLIKVANQDFRGALTDINRAIQLEPKLASAYSVRGIVKANFQDIKGALADYN
jgi:hypothetical protein